MANYRKAFNFRGGFQVDTDVLVVRGQKVGIGSTLPTERLDVAGTVKADSSNIDNHYAEQAVTGLHTVRDDLYVGVDTTNPSAFEYPFGQPQVRITTGIITSGNPALGVVTYYGDGAQLLNLPTSQWLDVDPGLGFTSIYAQGNVGIATTMPLYNFQIGGTPFPKSYGGFNLGFQTGFAVEGGNVYASGVVTTRGEFIGVGSQITLMDARNLGIGTIPVARYGPLIVTEEVIAPKLTGIASTAISVTSDATLEFDTARANEITAVNRFISTEGKLQIGPSAITEIGSEVGDIDLFKEGDTSTIYSISNDSSSRIFVGREREVSSNRRFGGIRFGGANGSDPLSLVNDLDIVNYDIGNVNYYLHAGSGSVSATIGEFRWIYGKTDRVLATLDPNSKFTISSNLIAGEPSLDVVGLATFQNDAFVNLDFYVGQSAWIGGDLTIGGGLILGNTTLQGATFEGDVIVGSDPTLGTGEGVGIGTTGQVIASQNLIVWGVGSPAANITKDGDIEITGSLFADGGADVNLLRSNSIELVTNMTGPNNFGLDINGLLVDNLSVDTLAGNNASIDVLTPIQLGTTGIGTASIDVANLTITDTFTANGVEFTAGDINAENLNLSGDISAAIDGIFSGDLTAATGSIPEITSNDIQTATLVANQVTAGTYLGTSIVVNDITANILTGVGTITVSELAGDTTITGNLLVNDINASDVNATNFVATNQVTSPNASVDTFVQGFNVPVGIVSITTLTSTNATVDTLNANTIVGVSTIDVDTITGDTELTNILVTGNSQLNTAQITSGVASAMIINDLVLTETSGFTATGQIDGTVLTMTGGGTFDTVNANSATITSLNVDTISGSLSIADSLTVGTDLSVVNINASGDITANDLFVNNVTISGSLQDLDIANLLTVGGDIEAGGQVSATGFAATTGSVEALSASFGSLSGDSIDGQTITANRLIESPFAQFTGITTAGIIDANIIRATNIAQVGVDTLGVTQPLGVGPFTSTEGQIDELSANNIITNFINASTIKSGSNRIELFDIQIEFDLNGGDLRIRVYDLAGSLQGTGTVPLS